MAIPLVANQLHKSYGDVHALKGIDVTIEGSGVYAILGQNGAGKTSFIKCVLGLEKASSSSISTMGYKAVLFR
ncbi:MAG: ATP-binding cassette domain-containing protein [Glaciecola sp.]